MTFAPLCEDCFEFDKRLSSDPTMTQSWYTYPKGGIEVALSAQECKLCTMLVWAYSSVEHSAESRGIEKVYEIQMHLQRDWNEKIAEVGVVFLRSHEGNSRTLFVWSSVDSAGAIHGSISALPGLAEVGGHDTISLIQSWIDRCTSTHQACRMTLAKEPLDETSTPLP